jgi:hypothetical protein
LSRWGFQVGNVVVEVDGEGPRGTLPRFEPIDPPTLRLHALATDDPIRPTARALHDVDGWAVFADDARGAISFVLKSDLHGTPEFARVDLDPDGETGRLVFRRGLTVNPLNWKPLDELIVLDALWRAGGLLMHTAAIAASGGGLLLTGISGAGKTTIARACAAHPGVTVLTDERAVVRPSGDGWVVDGTPWPGDGFYMARATVPLRALMLLEQAEVDRLERLSPARAMALLYRCNFPPFWSAAGGHHTLDALERLVREVPAYRLHNRLGGAAPSLLLAHLAEHPG